MDMTLLAKKPPKTFEQEGRVESTLLESESFSTKVVVSNEEEFSEEMSSHVDDDDIIPSQEDYPSLVSKLETLEWSSWIRYAKEKGYSSELLLKLLGESNYAEEFSNGESSIEERGWYLLENLGALIPFGIRKYPSKTPLLLDDVLQLLRSREKIVILTGAGISVSCGIPDFRSEHGIYERIRESYNLTDPQMLFDIHYFDTDPQPFFSFAKELWPGSYRPSITHDFIRFLETQGKLLRNYTQNIDALEQAAGVERLIQCHGSFATATCRACSYKVPSDTIRQLVLEGQVPYCPMCDVNRNEDQEESSISPGSGTRNVLKPDIVFFGEMLSDAFSRALMDDQDKVDLLIVIGSSLKVHPVASILHYIPQHVPRILINREPVNHFDFDVQLLGNCDTIVKYFYHHLGWKSDTSTDMPADPVHDTSFGYIFEGALLNPSSPSSLEDSEMSSYSSSHDEILSNEYSNSSDLSETPSEYDIVNEEGSFDLHIEKDERQPTTP